MAKFRKKPTKPEEVEATQWFKNGDHPGDDCKVISTDETANRWWSEGKVVGNFPEDQKTEGDYCSFCGKKLSVHGWIKEQHDDGMWVCPGEWVVTNADGEMSVLSTEVFERDYEPVED